MGRWIDGSWMDEYMDGWMGGWMMDGRLVG